jgi:hypothetical protein
MENFVMRRPAFYFSLLLLPFCAHAQQSGPVRAIVEGDVVNVATNGPIANARVRLSTAQAILYGKVDRQGHFTIGNLSPGSYQLTVDSPGFVQSHQTSVDLSVPAPGSGRMMRTVTHYPDSQIPDAKVTKSIDADGTIHGVVSVPLLAYSVIAGKVTDPYGLPMMNCTIEVLKKIPPRPAGQPGEPLLRPGSSNEFQSVRGTIDTDDRGEYRIQVEPGTYWVVANKQGSSWHNWESADRVTYFPAAISLGSAKPLELAAGQLARADIQIVRQAGVRVAGKLLRPPGAADSVVDIPGSGPHSFLYTNLSLVPAGSALMNSNGPFINGQEDYVFQDVMPGKYTLMALTRDAASDPSGQNQKPLFGLIKEVVVGERDMDGFDLALEPLRDLAGEVIFGEGCKPTRLDIRTNGFSPLAGSQVTVVSGTDGKFVLRGLTTGRLNVAVSSRVDPGQNVQVSSIRLGDRDVQKNGLDVPYQGSETLRIAIDCANVRRQQ